MCLNEVTALVGCSVFVRRAHTEEDGELLVDLEQLDEAALDAAGVDVFYHDDRHAVGRGVALDFVRERPAAIIRAMQNEIGPTGSVHRRDVELGAPVGNVRARRAQVHCLRQDRLLGSGRVDWPVRWVVGSLVVWAVVQEVNGIAIRIRAVGV
jgi:hypothetical protein